MDETTARRKSDHLKIVEDNMVDSTADAGWSEYRFVHNALPDLDIKEIDLTVNVFGKRLEAPIIISSMTGGTADACALNRRMALLAQSMGLAMGVGSQRIALENRDTIDTFYVRDVAPDILLFANLGAAQLNYGVTPGDCRFLVDAIGADGLFLHLNSIQEALQEGGNTNFRGLLDKIRAVCRSVGVPVVAKEVGWGISTDVARALCDAGVAGIDVAGAGGTSWSAVERARVDSPLLTRVAEAFANWGIPTAEAVAMARSSCPDTMLIASGGMRNGVDMAKALALGADLCGLAAPVIRAAMSSSEDAHLLLTVLIEQLRLAMFGIGVGSVAELRATRRLVKTG